MIQKIRDYIEKYHMIEAHDRVVLGVSGGADSMCLLFVLSEIAKDLPIELSVVHVEHGIRGEDSLQDARYVKEVCEQLQIPCREVSVDCTGYAKEHGLTVEEAGRILRYEAFEEEKADKIAVAHHKNDVAETLLFQLFRGSGIRGLASISPVRDRIIRPLLCVTRKEIEAYLGQRNIPYRTDSTNLSDAYSRNRIRLNILPEAERINEQAVSHMTDTAEILREADNYLTHMSDVKYEEYVTTGTRGEKILSADLFSKEADIIIKYVLKRCLLETAGRWKDLTAVHMKQIMELADRQSGKQIQLPYGIEVQKIYDNIVIKKTGKKEDLKPVDLLEAGSIILSAGKRIAASVRDYEKNEVIPNELYTKWFDYDKIKNNVQLRTRQTGDYLYIDEALSKKKLKTYFINEKIPVDQRDKTLLLADGSHILWVIGYRISEGAKVSPATKRILVVEIQEGEK